VTTELREALENERRAKLHRQIGALEAALEEIGKPRTRWEDLRAVKLKYKIEQLKRNLAQPMLLAM
jgi:hypothetical protein